ncbi:hypothetical protein L1987_27831 [Smallanthus sonchifolius]|uniref:Uncharacterized protein n=1 Tax=Smallanthus sonchifolius TaxID=185202 RepID=A0ACB9IBW6_9ASTR|nr:hypothetical protein L1987_27831 [Smallanthus sonchifolius]
MECREHIPCEKGKGPDWLFDIDSFSQVFEPLIFSNMDSTSSIKQTSTSNDDYRLGFNGPSIRIKRPSIDPPSVVNAIEASEARTSNSNVTSNNLSDIEDQDEDIASDAADTTDVVDAADTTDAADDDDAADVAVEDISAKNPIDNHHLPDQNQSNLDHGIQLDVVLTQRINKEHPLENVIGQVQQGVQTRSKTHEANICLYSCFLSQVEPKKIDEALQHSSWIETMQEELLQFKRQEVWTLVDLPPGQDAIRTRWVFRNKQDERGIVIKNKARLVAQGYTQEEGID